MNSVRGTVSARRRWWLGRTALAALVAAILAVLALLAVDERWRAMSHAPSAAARPFGVLGDSDSHSYQDGVFYADDPSARGGTWRPHTLQWNEILARLRDDQLDPGPWGIWGTRRGSIARLQDRLGLTSRYPRKQDYRFNLAFSGAVCESLTEGPRRQAQRLLAVMDETPQRWRDGVVLIRIGTNSFGRVNSLDALARNPQDAGVSAVMDGCVDQVRGAVSLIRARHPETRFVLVGIFDNAHWARYLGRWRDPAALANIHAGLQRYDDGLRTLAAAAPGIAFFDDQAWFAQRWGSRGADGQPNYRTVSFGRGFRVTNSAGDEPSNATLADGHAGTVWNALWAQSLVDLMNTQFGWSLRPLHEPELVKLIDPDGAFGMR